jgi:hypothetical protein
MVVRFPSPLEKALAADIVEICDNEGDEAVILNALTTVLARFLISVDTDLRIRMSEHLKTAIPKMLHDLEAEHNQDTGC